ncbi:DNA-directed RNA polymerases IV and V subunit 4-like [Phragmites australis]|uniref:DNA-directed RNA polymerases IV and V subunit 4-like n=1 Tax=Phragmites australis TaxID=29695 RepID=UPI002D7733D6|nr:DNA-directed RNA polymerases IV and V subunit 4-like [Phragmites australis]
MDQVPNGRHKSSVSAKYVVIESSDSDSEGFVEELTPVHSKSNGKASSENLKTGGKASPFSKGEASKGKAYSAGKGGKGSASNAVPPKSDAELKLELDIPPNLRMLMNCEAAELLQEIHEHMAILLEDPKIKIPESFDKAFQYAKEGNHFTNANSVKQAVDPLKKCGVNDGEICMIANIGPETVEEVYALVPSLKATRSLTEGPITEVLAALANIKADK